MKTNIKETPLKAYPTIPKRWKPQTANYPASPAEVLRADGWRDLAEPEGLDLEAQKKGPPIYDKDTDFATYAVIALSPSEIAQRQQDALDADASAQKISQAIADGSIMFQRFLTYIQRLLDEGTISPAQARNSAQLLYLPLLPLKDGQFQLAKANVDGLPLPTNQKELAILNKVKEQLNTYLQ